MKKEVERNYLEITKLEDLREAFKPSVDFSISLIKPIDFQINRFLYKNIGKKHQWVDRLIWSEENWINHLSNENIKVYMLKYRQDLVGYFELIFHYKICEVELAYFGILEEYHNKKLGSYLLSEAIKKSFINDSVKRLWAHTCSLDHKHALNNYKARGMKIFKTEIINI